jgi:hypothetical protein
MPKAKNIAFAILCACLLSFCKRSPTTWDDDVVAPLANGSLSLANLFPDTTIKVNADSSLKIAFETALINYQLDSLLKIPDTTITTAFTLTLTLSSAPAFPPGSLVPVGTYSTENVYNLPSGILLKKAIVKQGKINYVMTNTVYQPLVYHYQLLSATKNGHILDTTFILPAADSLHNIVTPISGYINLAGYTIDFSGLNHSSFNTTDEIDSVHIAPNAKTAYLQYNQGFNAQFTFEGIVPQYALGYFGNQNITVGPDTASFSAFSSIKKGLLNLNSANVSLNVVNQFGVDMKANLSQLTSINTNNPSSVPLTYNSSVILNNLIVPAARDNNGPNNPVVNITPGTLPSPINLNNNNSNVKDFIGNLPNKLSYKLTAQINPPFGQGGGNQSGNNEFGYYGTSFSAYLSMDVPLYFSASNLMLADTISLNVSNVSQLQNINKGNLILTATNQYPFSIYLSAILLDGNKRPIDNLFSSPSLIEAPSLDANGKVIAPIKSRLYIPLSPQRMANLQKARYISYSATFNTVNQPMQVKFYSNYTLDLLLTADINYTIGK